MTNILKKISAFILILIITASNLSFAAIVNLAEFNYTAVPDSEIVSATGGLFSDMATLTHSSGTMPTYSTSSLSCTGWEIGAYWQIELSTAGYTELTIGQRMRSSNTGPKNFSLQYSTNGINFTDVGGIAIESSTLTDKGFFILPDECENRVRLYIRYTVKDTVSMNNGTLAPTGASNINNIVITSAGTTTENPPGEEEIIHVTSVRLDANEATIVRPNTKKLTAVIEPSNANDKVVTWSSDNEEVAIVNGGTVTAKAVGTANITATSRDGGKTAVCVVTVVNPQDEEVDKLTIKKARELGNNATVSMVEGIVTYIAATATAGTNIYIQDETAGTDLYYYTSQAALVPAISAGDKVRVTKGKNVLYNNLLELTVVDGQTLVDVISADNDYMSTVKTLKDVSKIAEYQSELVWFEDMMVGAYTSSSKFTELTDKQGNKINVYDANTILTGYMGQMINLYAVVSMYGGNYQLRIRNSSEVILGGDDDMLPVITLPNPIPAANLQSDYRISVNITDERRIDYAVLYYRKSSESSFSETELTRLGDTFSGIIPKSELDPAGMVMQVEASDGTNVVMSDEFSVLVESKPLIINITPQQGENTDVQMRPEITVEYLGSAEVDNIVLYLDGAVVSHTLQNSKVSYTPAADLLKGSHTAKIILPSTGGNTEYEWTFSVGEEELYHYFGQLHAHTNLSDGTGTVDEAYQYASSRLDFFALTEHSNSYDNPNDSENITDYRQSSSSKWKLARETADKYNVDGKFAAICGFEMTWSGSTGGYGHVNTFNTEWFASRTNSAMNLTAYYNKIKDYDASITQFNHPGNTFGDFVDFSYRNDAVDKVMNLIEVGNGEGQIRGSGYFPSYSYYTRALDKGWHVGPANNQDNHKKKWGDSNTARTVVLAPSLTRESVYDALSAKRVYATEDNNVKVTYKINGQIMGKTLEAPNSLKFSIKVEDNEPVGKISIIANGGVTVLSETFSQNSVTWTPELQPEYTYYYIRIDQADKDIIVTAPIWTGDAISAGVSEIKASKYIATTEDNITFDVSLYNGMNTSVQNAVVTLYDGGENGEKIGENTVSNIPAAISSVSGTASTSFNYKPTKIGRRTIYAKVQMNIGGKPRAFTHDMTITIASPQDLVKAVIDVGRSNSYVAGGSYSGKYSAFKELLANKSIALNEESVLSEAVLSDASILVISAPAAASDITAFSEAEITAIRDFANRGGSFIITGNADYGERSAAYNTSKQSNTILETIGSCIRLNDDEVLESDTAHNGGESQEYRIYFGNYNKSVFPKLVENLVPNPQNPTELLPFSFYSGASVYKKADIHGGNCKCGALIDGYPTTSSLDSDTKGDSIALTGNQIKPLMAEELANGAKVIVGGTTFFSDFEIDSTSRESYNNFTIVDNIINWFKPQAQYETITIGQLRANKSAYMGKKVVVEGYITSESVSQSEQSGRKNAFFDVIYVQGLTGGITVFGVSQIVLPLGFKVRVQGTVGEFEGDFQIQVSNENTDILVLDYNEQQIKPQRLTTASAVSSSNEGLLIEAIGKVTKMTDTSIFLDDGSSEARIYVNGYIGSRNGEDELYGKWDKSIEVGDLVSAVGLASVDPEGSRLRVRDTKEIQLLTKKSVAEQIKPKPEPVSSIGGGGGVSTSSDRPFAQLSGINIAGSTGITDIIGHWANNELLELIEKGIINGYSDNSFKPDNNITRAEFLTLIYRLEGMPAFKSGKEFSDASENNWFYNAVMYFAENNIVNGDNGSFYPNMEITREEMTAIVIRYLKFKNIDFNAISEISYNDKDEISGWALSDIAAATGIKLINGDNGSFYPKNNATRAEASVIIHRLINILNKEITE